MLMTQVSKPDRARIVSLYTEHFWKIQKIADIFPFSSRVVRRVLKEEKVEVRPAGWRRKRPKIRMDIWERADEVINLYFKQKKSLRQIGKILGCSTQPIINIIEARGLRLRTLTESRQYRTDKYGIGEEIKVNRPQHQPEATVNSKTPVKELRDKHNLTIDEIAEVTGKDRVDIFKELQ